MAVTITRMLVNPEWQQTESETHYAHDYLLEASGSDADPSVILESCVAALKAAFPLGAAYSVAEPRCRVVVCRVTRKPLEIKTGATTWDRICFGRVEWSTNSEWVTKTWRASSTIQLVSMYDRSGLALPAGEHAQVDYCTEHFYYRRVEGGAHWAGTQTHGQPTANTTAPMCLRAAYCTGRTNEIIFLGRNSDTWLCLGAQPVPLGTGNMLVTYTFAFKDATFGAQHEQWGWRDAAGTYHQILGQASFQNVLELTWPTEDGGGAL